MAVRPYMRSSLTRTLYDKMIKDESLRSLDKSKWYEVNLQKVDCSLHDSFILSQADETTEDFLDNCFEKSDWVVTQLFHAVARSLLCWFMSRTSINGPIIFGTPGNCNGFNVNYIITSDLRMKDYIRYISSATYFAAALRELDDMRTEEEEGTNSPSIITEL